MENAHKSLPILWIECFHKALHFRPPALPVLGEHLLARWGQAHDDDPTILLVAVAAHVAAALQIRDQLGDRGRRQLKRLRQVGDARGTLGPRRFKAAARLETPEQHVVARPESCLGLPALLSPQAGKRLEEQRNQFVDIRLRQALTPEDF